MAEARFQSIEARAGLLAGLCPLYLSQLGDALEHAPWRAFLEQLLAPALPYVGVSTICVLPIWIAVLLGAWSTRRHRSRGPLTLTFAYAVGVGIAIAASAMEPSRGLVHLIVVALGLWWLWSDRAVFHGRRGVRFDRELSRVRELVRGAAIAGVIGLASGSFTSSADAQVMAALCAVSSLAVLMAARLSNAGWRVPRALTIVLAASLTLAGAALHAAALPAALCFCVVPPLCFLALPGRRVDLEYVEERWDDVLLDEPLRFLVLSFAVLGVLGGLVLSLPYAANPTRGSVSFIDGVFTAFSAVCVTGLAVKDTGLDFAPLGQACILVLIQVGGLGIMAFSTAATIVLGRRMSLRAEGAAVALLGAEDRSTLNASLWKILAVTAAAEGVGAALLSVLFWGTGDSPGMAIWRGVFTSISAYCNAGFALQSDSLVSYGDSPAILHIVGLLIIIGGLGPPVVVALVWRRRRQRDLQTRLVLSVTTMLLVAPAIIFAALEWNGAFATMAWSDKIHHAWFQSVTTRTAGFNAVDYGALSDASITLTELLMFVGGSPGSTAGGVKTTTAAIVVLAIARTVRQQDKLVLLGRKIGRDTTRRAFAVVAVMAISVAGGLFLLEVTQRIPAKELLFEVVSALGTVGLSIGATAKLDGVGKIIVIGMMFVGRVGPLALFTAFAGGHQRDAWDYPEQEVTIA